MMHHVSLTPRAQRQLQRLPNGIKLQVSKALQRLAETPMKGAVRVKSFGRYFRLRCDDHRIIFQIEGCEVVVGGIVRRDAAYKSITRQIVA